MKLIKRNIGRVRLRCVRMFSEGVKLKENSVLNQDNFEEQYQKYLKEIPDYDDNIYQSFMGKVQGARNIQLGKYEKESEEVKRRVEVVTNCILNLTEMEMLYLNEVLEELMIKEEGIHPLVYTLDQATDIPKIKREYAHPVNFFLQQLAMQELWKGKEGVNFGGAGGASGGEGAEEEVEEVEEQTSFDLILITVEKKMKIKSIKEAKNVLDLGLKEAKDLMTSENVPLVEGVGKEEAEKLKEKFEAVGCTIEIK